jgi:GNAT superfamily N-acetyltransferase
MYWLLVFSAPQRATKEIIAWPEDPITRDGITRLARHLPTHHVWAMATEDKSRNPSLPDGFGRFFRDISMRVTELSDDDRQWVKERTELLFGGDFVVSRTEVHDPHLLPGLIATEGPERVGLVTYCINGEFCEIVTIDALCQFMGIGTLLLEKVEQIAREAGCKRMWTITTNDRLDAQRFFQKRGFIMTCVRLGSMTKIRLLKPNVPRFGDYGIAVRDEIEFEKSLRPLPTV